MDAFDRYWQWAEKPLDSPLTLPAEIHQQSCHCSKRSGMIEQRSTRP